MKATFALLSFVGLAAAQDFSSVPACALGCIYKAIPNTGCELTDTSCLCRKEKQAQIQALAGDCLNAQCSAADLTKAENLSKNLCAALTASNPATVTVPGGATSSSTSGFVTGTQSGSTTTSTASHASSTTSAASTSANSTTTTAHHNSTTLTTATPTEATATTTVTQTSTKSPNAAAGTAVGALAAVVALAFAL